MNPEAIIAIEKAAYERGYKDGMKAEGDMWKYYTLSKPHGIRKLEVDIKRK